AGQPCCGPPWEDSAQSLSPHAPSTPETAPPSSPSCTNNKAAAFCCLHPPPPRAARTSARARSTRTTAAPAFRDAPSAYVPESLWTSARHLPPPHRRHPGPLSFPSAPSEFSPSAHRRHHRPAAKPAAPSLRPALFCYPVSPPAPES